MPKLDLSVIFNTAIAVLAVELVGKVTGFWQHSVPEVVQDTNEYIHWYHF